MMDYELYYSVAQRMTAAWRDWMPCLIRQFYMFSMDSSTSASLWKYFCSPQRACPVISLECLQSVLMPYLVKTPATSVLVVLCSCFSSSCSSSSFSFKVNNYCLMKDSTSICISCVAIELLSVRATTGRGGRLPNDFLGGYGFEMTRGGSGLEGTCFNSGCLAYGLGGSGCLRYLLAVLTRGTLLSLGKPATAVLDVYCLGGYFLKTGLETVVVLARFYIDFEFILSGFSYFYLEFWKGRFATLYGGFGSLVMMGLGAPFEFAFLSREAIFYLPTSLIVSRAFLLLFSTAVFLFLSYSLSSFRALGCFFRVIDEHSLNRSSAYCSYCMAQLSTLAYFCLFSSFNTYTSFTSAFLSATSFLPGTAFPVLSVGFQD